MDDEKEEYREKIIEMVNNIKDERILIYLYAFIKEKIKAEEWTLCLYNLSYFLFKNTSTYGTYKFCFSVFALYACTSTNYSTHRTTQNTTDGISYNCLGKWKFFLGINRYANSITSPFRTFYCFWHQLFLLNIFRQNKCSIIIFYYFSIYNNILSCFKTI